MTKQVSTDSNNVVQIAGNANISYGLTVHEVKELVNLFMNENFPKLREEAMTAAHKNVSELMSILETKLIISFAKIDQLRFADPDIQGSINDAVMATAKGGARSHPEILADLVLERTKSSTDDFVSLVAREAILIVPKLTPAQISFLSLVTFLRNMKLTTAKNIANIENLTTPILPAFEMGYGLSDANKLHLQFTGCASVISIFGNNIIQFWKQTYPFLSEMSDDAVVSHIETNFPSLNKLRLAYASDNIAHVTLTSVGQMVGLTNISKHIGYLDYTNWLY